MNSEDAPWTIVESFVDGDPVVIRFREFDESIDRSLYPHRLNIFWECSDLGNSRMPTNAESDRMSIFENRLIAATGYDSQAILAAALTGKGRKEFIFQARDPQIFLKLLTEMPQEAERYPITIQHYDDPSWGYFDRVTAIE